MLEVLTIVAALCKVDAGGSEVSIPDIVNKAQLECQKHYIRCIRETDRKRMLTAKDERYFYDTLAQCTLERTIK